MGQNPLFRSRLSILGQPPRGLLIVPIGPAPTGNGLAMRAAITVQGLAGVCNLTTLVVPVSDPGTDARCLTWAAERSKHCLLAPLPAPIDAARGWIANSARRAMIAALQPLPQRTRLTDPDTVSRALGETTFDLVWTMRLYLAPLARPFLHRAALTILDIDEDDGATAWAIARLHRKRREVDAAARLETEAEAYTRLREHCWGWFDHIVTASESESAALLRRYPSAVVKTVPNAVERVDNPKDGSHGCHPTALLFLGNMDYLPNFDAATWLVESIFPILRRHLPMAELHLVGGGRAVARLPHSPGVQIRGFVPDLEPLYRRMAIAVVPLRAGGGSRLKILEAFAHGLPVVATSAAAAGLDLRDGDQILIANDATTLTAAVVRIATNADLAARLAVNARRFITERHDAATVAKSIGDEILSNIAGNHNHNQTHE